MEKNTMSLLIFFIKFSFGFTGTFYYTENILKTKLLNSQIM